MPGTAYNLCKEVNEKVERTFGVKSSKITRGGNEEKIRSNENHSMCFNNLRVSFSHVSYIIGIHKCQIRPF